MIQISKNVLVVFIACLSSISYGQLSIETNHSSIDKKDLREIINVLTTDSIKERQTGTEGQKRAAKFIADRFENIGLNKIGQEGFYQKIKLNQFYWGEVYLKAGGKKLENFKDMAFMGNFPLNDEVERGVVFGGNGLENQLDQIDVRDRVVLVFIDNLRLYYEVAQRLKKRGAFAVVVANPSNSGQFEVLKKTFEDYRQQKRLSISKVEGVKLDTTKSINEFLIPNREVKRIMSISIGSLEKFISTNSLKTCPLSTIQIKCEKVLKEIETENLVGVLPGKTKNAILISAHYDTFNHLGKNPGADDNATGVSSLLELAERFRGATNMKYTIVFLVTTAEEDGLLGSLFYANSPHFNSQAISFNLNIDMIGRTDEYHKQTEDYLYCVGSKITGELDVAIKEAASLNKKCQIDFRHYNSADISYVNRGDHANFSKMGVPSVMFFGGVHEDYHQPSDTIEKINFDLLQSRVILISKIIESLQYSTADQ